jgi:hypothetical protein
MKQETIVLNEEEETYQLDKDRENMVARRTAKAAREGRLVPLAHPAIANCSCNDCKAAMASQSAEVSGRALLQMQNPTVSEAAAMETHRRGPGRPPRETTVSPTA